MTVAAEDGLRLTVAKASFDQFYAANYASIVRMAVALTGRPDLAEELAQEAFLSAYRRWPRVGRLGSRRMGAKGSHQPVRVNRGGDT